MMLRADRLKALMALHELSQSELARRVGVTQTTIRKLVSGGGYGSKHLHRIARALLTTPEYLTGETDDPDANAPLPPQPSPVIVTMEVVLPPVPALKVMFKALLAGIDRALPLDEQAQLLAERLPIGLGQLQYARTGHSKQVREIAVEDRAMLDPEPSK